MAIAGVTTGLTQSAKVGVTAGTIWKVSETVNSNTGGADIAPPFLYDSATIAADAPQSAINPNYIAGP